MTSFLAILLALSIVAGAGGSYYFYQSDASVRADLASTTESNATLQQQLANSTANNAALADQLAAETRIADSFSGKVSELTGTVSDLNKLAETDPQLLDKYSKTFFLSENYTPSRLTSIDAKYRYTAGKSLQFETDAYPFLENLINDAHGAGVDLSVASAYRSFGQQAALKEGYTVTYGVGANAFSADQGYSEHQLGTTVDFTAKSLSGALDGFDKTASYTWLKANAYKYGFELSYPPGNSLYEFEPWHWRFVGVKLATYLHDNTKNFYDLDQRTLDGYLISIFDTN